VRGIANSKIGFGDLILLLRYFFKLKVSTHPNILQASADDCCGDQQASCAILDHIEKGVGVS
ncbi:hypothetical protein ACG9X1_16725, partial [Acinetobacter baumannii]